MNILVVDDMASIREVVAEELSHDHQVSTAADGNEAVALMADHCYDVVILDIAMPGANGWETLQLIRDEDNGWPDTKVIMLTVVKDPESVVKAWQEGATFYLPKPFSRANLLTAVNRCLPS